MKKISVVLSPEAEEIYLLLKSKSETSKKERSIINAISRKIELIKENPEIGESLGKNLIPKEYIEKYKINNLRRIELPCYWRMLYYLTSNNEEIEIIAFVLDILDHNKYNKKFKYK
jgi:hypothetical protein